MPSIIDSDKTLLQLRKDNPSALIQLLSDVAEEELPGVLLSLDLPAPPDSQDYLIARCVADGVGGFRRIKFENVLQRVENEPVVSELRNFQNLHSPREAGQREEVGGGFTTNSTFASIATTEAEAGTLAFEYQRTAQPRVSVEGLAPDNTLRTIRNPYTVSSAAAPESAEPTWMPHMFNSTGQEDVAAVEASQSPTVSALALLEESMPDVIESGRIEYESLADVDLRGVWVHILQGRLNGLYYSRPSHLRKGVVFRIPRAGLYLSVEYGALLTKLGEVTFSTEENSVEVREETILLNALVESVDLERQWHALNDRRQVLILRKYSIGLTREEKSEFDRLQDLADRRMDKYAPRLSERFAEIDRYIRLAGLDEVANQ